VSNAVATKPKENLPAIAPPRIPYHPAIGEKFGIECHHGRDGQVRPGVNVANYERLHYYNPADFAGVVCDESSAIKAMSGQRRKDVTRFMSKHQYRFLFTATAAPNDYIELGTSSEALGYLGQKEMLTNFFRSTDGAEHVFFKQDDFWNTHKFMFKAHSEEPFWRWVCSWARAIRRPSDLGFSDERFNLPPLNVIQHIVENPEPPPGELFHRVAHSLKEQRAERHQTLARRCEKVLELVSHNRPAVVWCHSNEEGDLLEDMIPGCVQIAGRHSDEEKEESFAAFSHGQARVLVTKPKIGAWGLNWQHCDHMTFFPSHSFEQFYQGVRRCWRFGQKNPVTVDIVTTEGEAGVTGNLNRKAAAADQMFAALVREMNNALAISRAEVE